MRMEMETEGAYKEYTVTRRIEETPTAVTLWLSPQKGERPGFISGQFVNVLLPERGVEAKSYTLQSIPSDEGLAFTVRVAGDFSRTLAGRRVGDTVHLSPPYGFFYPVDETTPRLFLAGGIGVAPFMSIIRASLESGALPPTLLLYSNRSEGDIVFREALEELEHRAPQLSIRHFITREPAKASGFTPGRISSEHLAAVLRVYGGAHCFLCGGIAFVRDMRLALKTLGAPEESIFTEAFF